MAKKFDLKLELAGLLTAALTWRNDTGVYAWAIGRELGLTIDDEEAAVLAQLREALAAPASRVKITVTGDCGHVLWTGFDKVDEKYPFGCSECEEDKRTGKYPWKLATEIVPAEPEIAPHDDGTSYCTSLPLHDHDQAAGACPIYRPGENGFRWQCMLGMAHNNPDQDPDYDPQLTVHRDQFGAEFRVARCQDPAAHGMPHCWCGIPEHHKPLEPEPDESAAPVYLLACGCQESDGHPRKPGALWSCKVHGDTTVTMAIPLGAPASEPPELGKLAITESAMTSNQTRHKAELVKLPSPLTGYSWQVTWLPDWHLTRDQAITAMTIAEFAITRRGALGDVLSPAWSHLAAWADEIGITPERALALASVPPEDIEAAGDP